MKKIFALLFALLALTALLTGCRGGKCAKVCENEAITQNPKTGVYMINRKKCVSCGKCVEVCPMKVMVLKPENPASKCISCGACVKACPMGVLEIVEK